MSYIESIKTAVLFFPLIAFLFTFVYILYEYHKYGSINKIRTFIVYSFILYLITIYFLVILPLPELRDVIKLKTPRVQLIPFKFVFDFIKDTVFNITKPNTYLTALKQPCFYVVIFNMLMFVPFGMYLRYYNKLNLKKVILFSFLLSLFFELTQLSGLYFIYPRGYRLCDIDDLIINTSGGILGYLVMGCIDKFLPSRDKIDLDSYEKGKIVSGLRRLTRFFLDLFIYIFLFNFIRLFINKKYIIYMVFIIYYILIPIIFKGYTLGGKFLNVKIEYENKKVFRTILRVIFYLLYYYCDIYLLFYIFSLIKYDFNIISPYSIYLGLVLIFVTLLFYFINIIQVLRNKIFYDKVLKIKYISTIKK